MKTRSFILLICITVLTIPMLLCGCKDKDVQTGSTETFIYTNPPFPGTEAAPEEDGVIMGEEEEGSLVPPSLTAPQN